jgi:hypothetical protein
MLLMGVALAAAMAAKAPAGVSAAKAAAESREAVRALAGALSTYYPVTSVARLYARTLNKNLAAGRYAGLAPCDLAGRLTGDLQAAHRDVHLRVSCKPPPAVAAAGPAASTDPAPSPPSIIQTAERVDDSVFLLASRNGWPLTDQAAQEAVSAMALAKGAKYVVVDLRDNPGGSGIIGNIIASYFYDFGEAHMLLRGAFRDHSRDSQEGTYPYVPGARLPDAKVFIVVNGRTASAAEGFAFGLQKAGRATVVGQTTAGAGIAGSDADLGDGIQAFIPLKMLLAADGSKGWEGVGVTPDVATKPGEEFDRIAALISAELGDGLTVNLH